MQNWRTPYLGLRELPRELSAFELQTFFTFSKAERDAINARRGKDHQLGLALHIGFLRMTGKLLNAFRIIPSALLTHLGKELGIVTPDIASLRALYGSEITLFRHQRIACEILGFQWMNEHQRRALVRELHDEATQWGDRGRLLVRARHWLYKHRLLITHERALRMSVATALGQFEAEIHAEICAAVPASIRNCWSQQLAEIRPDGQTRQTWLWAAPAKHSSRQISEVLERIDDLYAANVHQYLKKFPDLILRRYARRFASRTPSASARIKEPARTVEIACFLRYCLLTATDQLIVMVQRRIADLWRQAARNLPDIIDWNKLYLSLIEELVALNADDALPDIELRQRIELLVIASRQRQPPSRASLVRDGMIKAIRPVRYG